MTGIPEGVFLKSPPVDNFCDDPATSARLSRHFACSISGAKHSPPSLGALVALRAEILKINISYDWEPGKFTFSGKFCIDAYVSGNGTQLKIRSCCIVSGRRQEM